MIVRCKQGDGQAFRLLFERYYQRSYRVAYAIVRDRALTEDIVQEAFVQAHKSIGNLRPGEPFGPWFYQVLVRKARRMSRTRRWLTLVSLDASAETGAEAPDPAAEARLAQLSDRDELWRAMESLSPAHREVLVLRYLTDLDEAEIARITDVPPGTVKSRLHHARAALARRLQETNGRLNVCPTPIKP